MSMINHWVTSLWECDVPRNDQVQMPIPEDELMRSYDGSGAYRFNQWMLFYD